MMRYAIQALEYELGRKLDEVEAISRELTELRRLAALPYTVTPARDPGDGYPPTITVPPAPALPSSAEAGAGEGEPDEHVEADQAPPGGIERPLFDHVCTHCSASFESLAGLRIHAGRKHPIGPVPFDPDRARARAADAAYNDSTRNPRIKVA